MSPSISKGDIRTASLFCHMMVQLIMKTVSRAIQILGVGLALGAFVLPDAQILGASDEELVIIGVILVAVGPLVSRWSSRRSVKTK